MRNVGPKIKKQVSDCYNGLTEAEIAELKETMLTPGYQHLLKCYDWLMWANMEAMVAAESSKLEDFIATKTVYKMFRTLEAIGVEDLEFHTSQNQ